MSVVGVARQVSMLTPQRGVRALARGEEAVGDRIDTAEICAALHRITGSEIFRRSPQLTRFLQFVVEAALHDDSERIKGYTIATKVLGRVPSFDPRTDPIVRVEAARLTEC